MTTPKIAQKAPYAVELAAGKTVYWCRCGLSARQPFCDGSHKDTGISPMPYTPEKDGKAWLCGCKHSASPPLCDASHKAL